MEKLIILLCVLIASGCASWKYPNWEQVKIETSVYNKPCSFKAEEVNSCKATVWFKKRATLYNANTVVLAPSSSNNYCLAGYFSCGFGNSVLNFNKDDYVSYLKLGKNEVTGQAFLRQKRGGIITCAGEKVFLYPNTSYFNKINAIRSAFLYHEGSEIEDTLVKQTKCDAQGNFIFYNIPPGNWVLKTEVAWSVFWVNGIYKPPISTGKFYIPGSIYYGSREAPQGGILMLAATVKDDNHNRFIISE